MVSAMTISILIAVLFSASSTAAQPPQIVTISPSQNALQVDVYTNISITFDSGMSEATLNSSTIVVYGNLTGLHPGAISYNPSTHTVTFNPTDDFYVGEIVTVRLTIGIHSSTGEPLDAAYAWSFTTAVDAASPGTFYFETFCDAESLPIAVTIADLDGDGFLDLAAVALDESHDTCYVTVSLNDGYGDFNGVSRFILPDRALAICAADFDNDSDIDLAVPCDWPTSSAVVLFNDGQGYFATQDVYPLDGGLQDVVSCDVDGDGWLDLVVVNSGPYRVNVFINRQDGTFDPPTFWTTGSSPSALFAADFDNDGDVDLATSNYDSGDVSVLLNNGDKTFAPYVSYASGDGPVSIYGADVDGDGDIDLATTSIISLSVDVLFNNSDGTYATPDEYTDMWDPYSVNVADLDGDGDLDMSVGAVEPNCTVVKFNNGDGTYGASTSFSFANTCASTHAADIDRDGDLDIVEAAPYHGGIAIMLNRGSALCGDVNGSGAYDIDDVVYLLQYIFASGPGPDPTITGDVDCSGYIDIDDVVYLIYALFTGGPGPCANCPF